MSGVTLASGDPLLVEGDLTSLSLAGGFVTGSAHFKLTRSLVGVQLASGDLTDAVLLTLELSSLNLNFGAGAVSFEIHGGSLALASLSAPAVTSPASDNRVWLAIKGSVSSITFHGIPGLSLDLTALTVSVNTASGSFDDNAGHSGDASALDWTQALDLNGDATFGDPGTPPTGDQLEVGGSPIDFTGAFIQVSGTAQVNIFGFVSGTVSFTFKQQTVNLDANGDGVFAPGDVPSTPIRGPPDLSNAVLTTLDLTIGSGGLFIGSPGGVGIHITSGSVAVATLSPSKADITAGDGRSWLALKARDFSGSLTGIPVVQFDAEHINIDVNQANGAFTNTDGAFAARVLDWAHDLDLNRDGTFADSLSIGGKTIDYADELIHAEGDITTINVADLVTGSAHFDVTRKPIKVNQGGLVDASLVTFALSSLHLSVGTATFGVSITGGSIAIAAITPTLSTDTRRWVAVVGHDLGASLNLAGFVTATLDNVELQVNSFSGGATVLNWQTSLDLNSDGTVGGPADQLVVNSVPVDLTSDLTKVEGDLTSLNIANLVSGSAHFEVTKRTIHVNQAPAAEATLITFGLSNLHLSVGTDTFGVSITGGSVAIAAITPTLSTDTRRWVAVIGHDLGASLNLAGFVTATLDNVELQVNNFSGGATVLDWTTKLDLNNDGTFGADPADQLVVNTVPVDLTSDLTKVEGDLTSLNIANVVSGSAHFEVTKRTTTVDSSGHVPVTLITFGLSNLHLAVGTDTFGVSITSGSIAIASARPTDTADTRRWVAVVGHELGASLNLGGFVTATLQHVELKVNSVSGSGTPTVLDWTSDLDLNGDSTFGADPADQLSVAGVAIDLTDDKTVVAGDLTNLNIADLVTGSAHFEVTKQTIHVTQGGSVAATLMTFGLSSLNLTVGTSTFGVTINSGSVAIAAITPTDTSDTRRWLGVRGTELGATLNLGGFVTATLQHVEVRVNRFSGGATALNWLTSLDLNNDGTFGADPADKLSVVLVPINLTTDEVFVAGDLTGLDIAGLVSGSAHFEVKKQTIQVNQGGTTSATLLTFGLSNLNLTVGTSSFGLTINAGSIAIAAITPTIATDTRRWLAVKGTELGASLNLGGLVTATLQHVTVSVNNFSGGATVLNWLTSLNLNGNATFGENPADRLTVAGVLIDLTDDQTIVSGDLASLDIAGLVSGSAHFELKRQTIHVTNSPAVEATLLTFALSNLSLSVGTASFGVTINGGSIAIAAITPTATTDPRRWLAVKGTDLSATLNLGSFATAVADHVSVMVNRFSGTGATALNWDTSLDLNNDTTFGDSLSVNGTPFDDVTQDVTQIAGNLKLRIGTFVYVSGGFSLIKTDTFVTRVGDTTTTHVSLLKLGINGGTVFAGIGNPDTSGDGFFTSADNLATSGAVGISLTNVTLGLALMSDIPASGASTKSFLALRASGTASLVGISGIDIVGTLEVDYNTASDSTLPPSSTAPVIDFTQLPGGKMTIPTGPSPAPSIDIAFSDGFLKVAGTAMLRIQGFVFVSAAFSIEQDDTPQTVTLETVTPPDTPPTRSVTTLKIGVSSGYVFVGVGGPYFVINPDGSVSAPASPGGAMGLALTNVTLALALMKPTDTAFKTESYYGLQASGGVQLVGITGVNLIVDTLGVEVNGATGSPGGRAVDFITSFGPSGLRVDTGPSSHVDLKMQHSVLRAFGDITLTIGQFVYVSGSFSFEKGSTITGALLSDGTTADLSVLKIGATGVKAFVGLGGPYWAADGSLDPSHASAIGIVLDGVEFGLALMKPTTGTRSFYALKATAATVSVQIPFAGVGITVTGLELQVNGANDSALPVVNLKTQPIIVPTGETTSVTLGGLTTDFDKALLRASGQLTLTFADLTLNGGVFFESATDATLGRVIKVALTSVSVDFADFLHVAGVNAFLVVTNTGVAAKISVPLSFHYPDPLPTNNDPFVSFTAQASLEINTTNAPVHVTIGSDHFDLSEAGPYFRAGSDRRDADARRCRPHRQRPRRRIPRRPGDPERREDHPDRGDGCVDQHRDRWNSGRDRPVHAGQRQGGAGPVPERDGRRPVGPLQHRRRRHRRLGPGDDPHLQHAAHRGGERRARAHHGGRRRRRDRCRGEHRAADVPQPLDQHREPAHAHRRLHVDHAERPPGLRRAQRRDLPRQGPVPAGERPGEPGRDRHRRHERHRRHRQDRGRLRGLRRGSHGDRRSRHQRRHEHLRRQRDRSLQVQHHRPGGQRGHPAARHAGRERHRQPARAAHGDRRGRLQRGRPAERPGPPDDQHRRRRHDRRRRALHASRRRQHRRRNPAGARLLDAQREDPVRRLLPGGLRHQRHRPVLVRRRPGLPSRGPARQRLLDLRARRHDLVARHAAARADGRPRVTVLRRVLRRHEAQRHERDRPPLHRRALRRLQRIGHRSELDPGRRSRVRALGRRCDGPHDQRPRDAGRPERPEPLALRDHGRLLQPDRDRPHRRADVPAALVQRPVRRPERQRGRALLADRSDAALTAGARNGNAHRPERGRDDKPADDQGAEVHRHLAGADRHDGRRGHAQRDRDHRPRPGWDVGNASDRPAHPRRWQHVSLRLRRRVAARRRRIPGERQRQHVRRQHDGRTAAQQRFDVEVHGRE